MNDYSMKQCDLIFYQEGDKTKSLGFEIKNAYLNKMPAIIQTDRVGSQQSSFAVPAGLFLLHQTLDSMTNPSQIPIKEIIISDTGEHENIETNLYNRLLKLVEPTRQIKPSKSASKTAPKQSKTASKSPKPSSKTASKAPKPSKTASKPSKTAPKPSKTAPKPSKTASKQTRKTKAKNKKKTRKNNKK
jgi:outer membrane biosynthesis protein TonB